METGVLRVLKLFSLTVPPIGVLAVCYIGLGEHVFGLSYVIGKRLKPRLKRALRAFYLLGTALTAIALFTALLTTCGGTASLCPPVRLGERWCLVSASVGAVWAAVMLLVERCTNALFDLGHPTGFLARSFNASVVVVMWFSMAHKQTTALLLLAFLATRRALASFPWANRAVGRLVKLATVLHMSRVVGHRCDDSVPKYAVAAVAAMAPL